MVLIFFFAERVPSYRCSYREASVADSKTTQARVAKSTSLLFTGIIPVDPDPPLLLEFLRYFNVVKNIILSLIFDGRIFGIYYN